MHNPNHQNTPEGFTVITAQGQRQYSAPDNRNNYYYVNEAEPVYDVENNNDNWQSSWSSPEFSHKSRRMAFVRKILGLVALQVVACSGWTALCIFKYFLI